MNVSLSSLLHAYLKGIARLSDLRDWLATSQWDAMDITEQSLVDSIDFALAQLDDRYITEQEFRSCLKNSAPVL